MVVVYFARRLLMGYWVERSNDIDWIEPLNLDIDFHAIDWALVRADGEGWICLSKHGRRHREEGANDQMCEGTGSYQHGDFSFCLFVEWGRVKSTDSGNNF